MEKQTDANVQVDSDADRRSFLTTASTLAMAGGLVAGYGTFFAMAGRYLFPSGSNKAWMFVADATRIGPGESIPFESPTGVRVTITRSAEASQESLPEELAPEELAPEKSPTADSFLALSSICPHLGCRVHWEQQNDRFFCPCHNGIFDPSGKATGGPPAADGQDLPRYPLKVVDGVLYIEMPYRSV